MGPEALGSQGHSEPATQEPGGELRPRLGQSEPAGQGLQLSSETPPGERDPHAGRSAPENRDLPLLGSRPSTRAGTELVPWASGLEVALARASLRAPLAFCRQSPALGTAYPGGVAWTRAHSREPQRPRPATLLLRCAHLLRGAGVGLLKEEGPTAGRGGEGTGQMLTWAASRPPRGAGHGVQGPLRAVVASRAGSIEGEGRAAPGSGAGGSPLAVVTG